MAAVKNIVVIGKKGAGKSTIGNCVLGRDQFPIDTNYDRKVSINSENSIQVHVVNTTEVRTSKLGLLKLHRLRQFSQLFIATLWSVFSSLNKVLEPIWYYSGGILTPVWRKVFGPVWHAIIDQAFSRILSPIWHRVLNSLLLTPSILRFWSYNTTQAYYFQHLPAKASLVIFVYKHGRITDEGRRELNAAIGTLNSDVSNISALVITGCEDFTPEAKDNAKSEFINNHLTQNIANFMKKGVYCVGFPNLKAVSHTLQEHYAKELNTSNKLLQTLIMESTFTLQLQRSSQCQPRQ